jgi:hypothetical protein
MKGTILRESNGRILGKMDYWFNEEENESYHDFKCNELTFPRHNQGKSSPVKVFHISELNKN